MNTGETAAVEISDKSKVSVALLVTIVGLAATAGAAHWRIGALETGQAEARAERLAEAARREAEGERFHAQDLRIQHVEDNMGAIRSRLDDIITELRRWSRGGDVPRVGIRTP